MSKILFISDTLPNIYHGGGGVTAFSILLSFLNKGHFVDVIGLSKSVYNYNDRNDESYSDDLKSIGITNIYILKDNKSIQRSLFYKFFPTIENYFSGYLASKDILKIVEDNSYDLIFAYHWNSIASIYEIKEIPKFGIVGDPVHLPYLFRKEYQLRYSNNRFDLVSLKLKILDLTQILMIKRMMKQLLISCDVSGAFAFHHANDFVNLGVGNCFYFRTPVPDPDIKHSINDINTKKKKFKILHIGHLLGIATISGVELLAKEIIPELDSLIGKDNYEIHLVGGHFESLPFEIQELLKKDNVLIRGQVSPSDDEFISCDVLLVPTPIELGIRVRIITGMSFGSCIVAHEANSKGIPELVTDFNCKIGNNGKSLANSVYELYLNPEFKEKIKLNSRLTYQKFFSIESAGGEIENSASRLILNLQNDGKIE